MPVKNQSDRRDRNPAVAFFDDMVVEMNVDLRHRGNMEFLIAEIDCERIVLADRIHVIKTNQFVQIGFGSPDPGAAEIRMQDQGFLPFKTGSDFQTVQVTVMADAAVRSQLGIDYAGRERVGCCALHSAGRLFEICPAVIDLVIFPDAAVLARRAAGKSVFGGSRAHAFTVFIA